MKTATPAPPAAARPRPTHKTLTVRAAQRLHGWSIALAALLSLVSVGGVVAGFAVALSAHSGKRAAGGLGIVGAALLFETGALVMCFLCQAIARHIEREAR